MKIRRLKLENFRCVSKGVVYFPSHTVIIGGNSVGKSTICEALDLLLGPDRLSRISPINEHDFFERCYLSADGEPIPIKLEAVLTNLTEDVLTKYLNHLEYWNPTTEKILDETNNPEDVDDINVLPALRIKFEGAYNIEEDEFRAKTFFASPPQDDETSGNYVSRTAKRNFGFIYLRALRTGSRALSLERGSLLDIILKLKDDDRSAMWEQTLNSLEALDPAIDAIQQLRNILDDIDGRVRSFVGLSTDERTFRLYPSALTRESVRRSITLFGSSEKSKIPVPYWRLGSGVINSMVFSLLTFIADLKSNVIFAMEEPEIALPPHTQRRIVQFLQREMDQSILTTHSPFVLEQFEPSDVVLLERENEGSISSRRIEVNGLKAKNYRGNLRRVIAEAMLGNGVICVEGISDTEVIYTASAVLEKFNHNSTYTPLDISGVTVVHCNGSGELLKYGRFFKRLGLKIYTIYDHTKQNNNSTDIDNIFDATWKLKQTGIENLLGEEVNIDIISEFLKKVQEWEDYPKNSKQPDLFTFDPNWDENKIRKLCKRVLKIRKGSRYALHLIELCSVDDLPKIIVEALKHISNDFPDVLSTCDEENSGCERL